jgi:hypothetical protein
VTATIGSWSILLALALALAGAVAPIQLARRRAPRLLSIGQMSIIGQLVLVTIAGASLL